MAQKTISFEDQLEKMAELFNVSVEDSTNVFTNYVKTLEQMTGSEADAGTKEFAFVTPIGQYSLKWVDESKRVNSTDGSEYTAPARYVGNFGFPSWLVDTANKNVDFSAVPSTSEIASAKRKAA